jgi:hypothetical protein
MKSLKIWTSPASVIVLALIGILIAFYRIMPVQREVEAAEVPASTLPLPPVEPPSNEIAEFQQLG